MDVTVGAREDGLWVRLTGFCVCTRRDCVCGERVLTAGGINAVGRHGFVRAYDAARDGCGAADDMTQHGPGNAILDEWL